MTVFLHCRVGSKLLGTQSKKDTNVGEERGGERRGRQERRSEGRG